MSGDMKKALHPQDISPLYHVVGPYNCRINEVEMSQNALAPGLWATIILREAPARVIEIGTCKGGLSAFLSHVCAAVGATFTTMDFRASLLYELAPGATFLQWDCFEHETEIRDWVASPGTTILLCDGGNKMREFNTFSPALKPGDLIAAHDCIHDTPAAVKAMTVRHTQPYLSWGWNEVRLDQLKLDGLLLWQPYWTQFSGWTVWQKVA